MSTVNFPTGTSDPYWTTTPVDINSSMYGTATTAKNFGNNVWQPSRAEIQIGRTFFPSIDVEITIYK